MKYQLLNNKPLQFYNTSGELIGTIEISSSGDMLIRPDSGSSRDIILGNQDTVGDIEVGQPSAETTWKFIGGGMISANGNTLTIGDSTAGDIVIIDASVFSGSFSGSFQGDGSQLTGIESSSYATTASYALTALSASYAPGGGGGSTFPFTGDAVITGSLTVSGSFAAFRVDTDNVILGTSAGANIVNGAENNVIIGTEAASNGTITTAADNNVIMGWRSGYNLTNGKENVIIGKEAGYLVAGSDFNVFVGTSAGEQIEGQGNIGIGQNAGRGKIGGGATGDMNISIGLSAGYSLGNPDYNILIGREAGYSVGEGSNNIMMGFRAGYNTNGSSAHNNTFLGYNAGYDVATGDHNILIGSGSVGEAAMSNQLRIGHAGLTAISASLITGDIILQNTTVTELTASGNISSSGTITAITGSFSYIQGNSPIKIDGKDSSISLHYVDGVDNSTFLVADNSVKLSINDNTTYIDLSDNGVSVKGEFHTTPLTASVDISSSGTISMLTASIGGGIFTSASLAAGGGSTFPFTGDAEISGSLTVTGSLTLSGSGVDFTNATSISGSTFSGSFVGDGSQLTGITAATNLTQSLFVSPSGDDGTARVGDLHLPFKTILGATGSANTGDTIIVYPGTYPSESSNIIKDGVNYYFYPGATVHPTASLNEWVVNIIDPVYPVNVRGAGTFISDDTDYGAIKIQAKECYFEFDTAKTTNNTTHTSYQGGTVSLEPTNTDGGVYWNDYEKGNPFYVKGNIVNTGDLGNYAGALVWGRQGINAYSLGTFEGSVMQLHPTDTRPAIYIENDLYYYTVNINATVFASGSEALLNKGRGDVRLRGTYSTGDADNKYAIEFADGYHGWYDIDADINGALRLNCGSVTNTGGILRGRLRTQGVTPDACAIYIDGGGQHKIDNQIFLRDNGAHGIKMDTDVSQVEFTGDFNADSNSAYVNFCKVTTGKLIFKGSLGHTNNRGTGNIIDGGHLVIDSFFDNDGYNYPNNAYCFVLSSGTLEINNKVTHNFTTTGSGIVDMTGGYLKLNGAELVQLSGTGSFAYGIDLNGGAHSGSILNNSFTNLTPFGLGSFTNEIPGGGTLFYSDKLY